MPHELNGDAPLVDDDQSVRYHLVIFQAGADFIERGMVAEIQDKLNKVIVTAPDRTEIDIWIDSRGGDAHAAYKLILELRSRCRRLRAVVPDFAKSAATLLVLGVDEIFMDSAAELGPLDVQLEHPDREGIIVSGLDIASSFEFLVMTAVNLACAGGATLITYTGLTRQTVLHETLQFMAQFLQPVVSKLDPHLVHQAFQELQIAEKYANRMLEMRQLTNGDPENSIAAGTLRKLVNDYPTHSFVISADEARELGLPIKTANSYFRWPHVKRLYEFVKDNGDSFIAIFPDSHLDEMFDQSADTEEVQSNGESSSNEREQVANNGEAQRD